MTQMTKDSESIAGASGAPAAKSPSPADTTARLQPVALEVPVTVNGARTVEGSDKREPFSESSQTVLVFGHGAVLRLSAALAPGQLVFLTNEKTKKEVVCQVVKFKTDANAVGYVELRFTEPSPGFWGMRFPNDTVLPPAPVQKPPSAAPQKPAAPLAPVPVTSAPVAVVPPAPKPVTAPPIAPTVAPEIAKVPAPVAAAPSAPVQKPAAVAPPSIPAAPPAEAPAPKIANVQASPASSSATSTEELKQQAARLQEQLSSLLFSEPAKPATAPLASPMPADVAKKVFDLASPSAPVEAAKPVAPAIVPPLKGSPNASISLQAEELKIPAWLAPLAHENDSKPAEAAAPVAASSVAADAEVASLFEAPAPEVKVEEQHAGVESDEAPIRRPETAVFGGQLLGETSAPAETGSSGSKKGLFIGIAAALVLAAGGAWYLRQPGNALSSSKRGHWLRIVARHGSGHGRRCYAIAVFHGSACAGSERFQRSRGEQRIAKRGNSRDQSAAQKPD